MEWFPEWRSDQYGDTDFKRLETIIHMAYLVCKDIDSTDMADCWPDEIEHKISMEQLGDKSDLKGLAAWEAEK